MRIGRYIDRTIMLTKELRNPPLFLYLVHHYLRKDMPALVAKYIAKKNMDDYGDNNIVFPTYDGSNQIVHPDLLFHDCRYWFVGTPYPYGMEEYENPCVYSGIDINNLSTLSNPIDRQQKHDIGFHLSDPCLFVAKGDLYCGYRENIRVEGVEKNIIYIKKYLSNNQWTERKMIIDSFDDPLLSPAFFCIENKGMDEMFMVHVNRRGNDSKLVETKFSNDFEVIEQKPLVCVGVPKDYHIWHIAVSFENGQKTGDRGQKFKGLFLLKNSQNGNDFQLYSANKEPESNWTITKKIEPPSFICKEELHPYKSCFIPNTNNILYSYIDKKKRYRLEIIKDNEVLA